jgi:nuclear mRNA export protein PCID2/THP1
MSLLVSFLTQIRAFVKEQNGTELRNWLLVESNAPPTYHTLAAELRSVPRTGSASVEKTIERCLPEDEDVAEGEATPWPGFITFMTDYVFFWREVDFDDLLGAHALLSSLVKYDNTNWYVASKH